MKEKLSIKDIAELVGTSITSVSFVINGKAREKNISKELTSRILEVVAELGYQPNKLAQSLRTGKSKILGFLVDDISEPFYSGIARLIDEKATQLGYKIIFSSTGNDRTKAAELLRIFRERHVDGYIIALAAGIEEEIKQLISTNVPVVLFDRFIPEISADYVLTDNFKSTYEATCYLHENGFKKIGFITTDSTQQQMLDRLNGYLSALSVSGSNKKTLKLPHNDLDNAPGKISCFLQENPDLDALIFAANYITMAGLKLAASVDDDPLQNIALVSFDDFELLEFIRPSITAIAQSLEAISENILNLLLTKLNDGNSDRRSDRVVIQVPSKLIIRQSTTAFRDSLQIPVKK